MDESLLAIFMLAIIGVLLIGLLIANSVGRKSKGKPAPIYEERCPVIYCLCGILRVGGLSLGSFAIFDANIDVRFIVTKRYAMSDLNVIEVARGIFSKFVAIRVKHSVTTIRLYSKNPEHVAEVINQIKRNTVEGGSTDQL